MFTARFQCLALQSQPPAAVYGLLLYHHSSTTPARLSAGGFLPSGRAFGIGNPRAPWRSPGGAHGAAKGRTPRFGTRPHIARFRRTLQRGGCNPHKAAIPTTATASTHCRLLSRLAGSPPRRAAPAPMSPSHKPQNCLIFTATRKARGDTDARPRVRRVTWHPAEPADNAPLSSAAPVRTVHYIPLRPPGRASVPPHEPASAPPMTAKAGTKERLLTRPVTKSAVIKIWPILFLVGIPSKSREI